MQKDDVRIGFGIMGGWNQAQAHAQFVADIADFGLTIQEALEAGRFTKGTFAGCDVQIESLVSDSARRELTALGHQLTVMPPRTGGLRLRPGGDEQLVGRPFRRVRSAPRWRGDSGRGPRSRGRRPIAIRRD